MTEHEEDVPVAERLAEAVALALSHHQLADEAEQAERVRERAANADLLEELLQTLVGVLDIREVFERVAAIAQKALPHDAMSIATVLMDPPRLRVHALSGLQQFPSYDVPVPEPWVVTEHWDHLLIDFERNPSYRAAASPA